VYDEGVKAKTGQSLATLPEPATSLQMANNYHAAQKLYGMCEI